MEYISRIVDDVIDRKTEAFNAVSIPVIAAGGIAAVSYTHLDVYKRQDPDWHEKDLRVK